MPLVSNVNFVAGQTVANLATVPLGTNHSICLYSSVPTQVVADLAGAYGPTTGNPVTLVVPATPPRHPHRDRRLDRRPHRRPEHRPRRRRHRRHPHRRHRRHPQRHRHRHHHRRLRHRLPLRHQRPPRLQPQLHPRRHPSQPRHRHHRHQRQHLPPHQRHHQPHRRHRRLPQLTNPHPNPPTRAADGAPAPSAPPRVRPAPSVSGVDGVGRCTSILMHGPSLVHRRHRLPGHRRAGGVVARDPRLAADLRRRRRGRHRAQPTSPRRWPDRRRGHRSAPVSSSYRSRSTRRSRTASTWTWRRTRPTTVTPRSPAWWPGAPRWSTWASVPMSAGPCWPIRKATSFACSPRGRRSDPPSSDGRPSVAHGTDFLLWEFVRTLVPLWRVRDAAAGSRGGARDGHGGAVHRRAARGRRDRPPRSDPAHRRVRRAAGDVGCRA